MPPCRVPPLGAAAGRRHTTSGRGRRAPPHHRWAQPPGASDASAASGGERDPYHRRRRSGSPTRLPPTGRASRVRAHTVPPTTSSPAAGRRPPMTSIDGATNARTPRRPTDTHHRRMPPSGHHLHARLLEIHI